MNIHEHQAKELIAEFGAPISKGVVIYNLNEIDEKVSNLKSNKFVVKAQIHAGGRGKAGGVKIVENLEQLKKEAQNLLGKNLITPQTGPAGKKVKRLYISSDVARATPDTDANCVKFNLADDILSIVGVADCCKRYNCAKSLAILNIGSLDLANENVPNLSKRTPRFCNNWDFITVPIACQTFITISKLIFFVAKLEHT